MAAPRLLDLVREHRDEIQATVERHRGLTFAVFGSAARGEDGKASDIDFLVRFAPGSSLFDLLHLSDELERILGRPVDVVSEGALKPRDEHIRAEAVRL
ncbi:MAG: nucleotidyltransferase family protein [Propionicimonas sp.]